MTDTETHANTGPREVGREGMVTVYDHEGRYVGCMGAQTWEQAKRHSLAPDEWTKHDWRREADRELARRQAAEARVAELTKALEEDDGQRAMLRTDKRFESGMHLPEGAPIRARETEHGWIGTYYPDQKSWGSHSFALDPDEFILLRRARTALDRPTHQAHHLALIEIRDLTARVAELTKTLEERETALLAIKHHPDTPEHIRAFAARAAVAAPEDTQPEGEDEIMCRHCGTEITEASGRWEAVRSRYPNAGHCHYSATSGKSVPHAPEDTRDE